MTRYPLQKPKFYLHWYKEFNSYAILFSLTTMNFSLQLGPIWFVVMWRGLV